MRKISIILVHWAMDELRSKVMRTSFDSLLKTVSHLPVEIIVINNSPENKADHEFFSEMVSANLVVVYVTNSTNMSFGYARNQGIDLACGEYIVIVDNDILYEAGWLDHCIRVLEKNPDRKIYASPIDYPTGVLREKYWQGEIDGWKLSMRAGSNCFVIRKNDLEEIGRFKAHRIAGTYWTDAAVRKGYLCAVTPRNMVKDIGLRNGYNLSKTIPIQRKFLNGDSLLFNEDGHQE